MVQLARWFRRFWSPLTLGSILTVAIGVGVNTAEFSLLKQVFRPPIPFPAPDEIVFLSEAIRLALGATPLDVTKWLLSLTMSDLTYAALLGAVLCMPAALLAHSLLNDLQPTSLWAVMAGLTLVVGIGVVGMTVPIGRALRLNLSTLLKDSV